MENCSLHHEGKFEKTSFFHIQGLKRQPYKCKTVPAIVKESVEKTSILHVISEGTPLVAGWFWIGSGGRDCEKKCSSDVWNMKNSSPL